MQCDSDIAVSSLALKCKTVGLVNYNLVSKTPDLYKLDRSLDCILDFCYAGHIWGEPAHSVAQ